MLQTNFNPFPTIETERLILRQLQDDDAPEMFAFRSNPDIMKYIARPQSANINEALQLIQRINSNTEKGDGINWAICIKGNNKMLGYLGFMSFKKEHYRSEVGYLLDTAFHRQGILYEALHAVLDYGFKYIGLHSIEAVVDPENIASIALLEKSNFRKEAHFKEDYFFNGKFLDSAIYSLLNREFT